MFPVAPSQSPSSARATEMVGNTNAAMSVTLNETRSGTRPHKYSVGVHALSSRSVDIVQISALMLPRSFALLIFFMEYSLAGVDLNRQWKRPSRALHPTVFWLKQHIRQEQAKKGVAMYIDLHGHRRATRIITCWR